MDNKYLGAGEIPWKSSLWTRLFFALLASGKGVAMARSEASQAEQSLLEEAEKAATVYRSREVQRRAMVVATRHYLLRGTSVDTAELHTVETVVGNKVRFGDGASVDLGDLDELFVVAFSLEPVIEVDSLEALFRLDPRTLGGHDSRSASPSAGPVAVRGIGRFAFDRVFPGEPDGSTSVASMHYPPVLGAPANYAWVKLAAPEIITSEIPELPGEVAAIIEAIRTQAAKDEPIDDELTALCLAIRRALAGKA